LLGEISQLFLSKDLLELIPVVQLGVAKSWYESLADCEAGGGTLLSLGTNTLGWADFLCEKLFIFI
jgi:hypothetical protein